MTISIHNGKLSFAGAPPFTDVDISVPFVTAALRLPPASLNPAAKTLAYVLANIGTASAVRFRKIVELMKTSDPQGYELFQDYLDSFAAIKEPGAESWPPPETTEVLEVIQFDLEPLQGALCTTDGRMFLLYAHKCQHLLVTAAEFNAYTGQSLKMHIANAARQQAQKLRRVLELMDAPQHEVHVTYKTVNDEVGTVIVKVRSLDQIQTWAGHRMLSIIDMEKQK